FAVQQQQLQKKMSTTPPPPFSINCLGILSESKRIISAHSRHFLALSLLFLLPLSFFLIAFPTFLPLSSSSTAIKSSHALLLRNPYAYLFPSLLLCASALAFLALSAAAATISHSVFHGFFGRPVKLVSALRSLPLSLFRLLVTALAAISVLVAFSVPIAVLVFLSSDNSSSLAITFLILSLLAAVFLYANWALAPVVVVAESAWGLEPLRRSAQLLRGARGVVVSLGVFFAAGVGFMLWLGSCVGLGRVGNVDSGLQVLPIATTVLVSAVMTTMLLYHLAANSVIYMYCKALQGELAGEIAEEFAREYVSLPFDEQKVPHLVSVVQTPHFVGISDAGNETRKEYRRLRWCSLSNPFSNPLLQIGDAKSPIKTRSVPGTEKGKRRSTVAMKIDDKEEDWKGRMTGQQRERKETTVDRMAEGKGRATLLRTTMPLWTQRQQRERQRGKG
ncbi:hypothetical protein ACLOJK_004052, partial [Asimina triloba]